LSVPSTVRDLGEIIAGETVETEFPYSNGGAAPLTIDKITASCGCLTSHYTRTLAPGEEGKLRVKLISSTLWEGPVTKLIELFSNDPNAPVVKLQITARARPLFRITPSNPYTTAFKRGEVVSQVFEIVPMAPAAARITRVASDGPGVEARLLPSAGSDGSDTVRVAVVIQSRMEEPDFSRSVLVSTTHPRVPTFRLIINGVAGESLTVSPPFLYLGTLNREAGTEAPRLVAVYKRRSPLRVLDARADTAALHVEIRPPVADNQCEIAVRYQGGWSPGAKTGKIMITTDDPISPKIEVPYQATVTGGAR
jgi:hypothetical protein